MKRILGYIGLVGVLGVTVWLIFSVITNSGQIFPTIKPVPANLPQAEFAKYEPDTAGFAKYEGEEPDLPNQPPAPPPPPSPTPTSEPESASSPNCDPFEGMELSLVTLSIREDIMVFPLYLKTEGDVIPGLDPPDGTPPSVYHALLNAVESNICEQQGDFKDRLYCMFPITPDMPGSVAVVKYFLDECEDPVFTQLYVTIPELRIQCTEELDEDSCEEAGGEMSSGATRAPYCICP